MKKPISLEEKKVIYLEMLREIDDFCRSHNIRYSLSSGTLIGAIRHGGFIPWDDDLDITMPLPDLLRFKNEFKSDKIRFCDVDTCKHYELSFPRLEYIPTYSKIGMFNKGMGVAIDIYVIVGVPNDKQEAESYFAKGKEIFQRRAALKKIKHFIVKFTPFSTIWGFDKVVKEYRDHLFGKSENYENANRYFRIAAAMKDAMIRKNILEFDFFDNLTDIKFEDVQCKSTGHAHEYLSQRYGNYMQLPPVEQRHPRHIADIYRK